MTRQYNPWLVVEEKQHRSAGRASAWGLGLVACAVLALQIELTRIFSVTMWYHFAFLAISVAMFGLSLGAVVVHLRGEWFPADALAGRLSWLSVAFAVSIPLSLVAHLAIPFMPLGTALGVFSVLATYLVVTVPFTLAGVVTTLVLTRFPRESGRLYAADMVGAALGCLAVFVLLNLFDGPTAVLATSLLAAAAAWVFRAGETGTGGPGRGLLAATSLILLALVAYNASAGVVAVRLAKNEFGLPMPTEREDILLERWNPMSRLIVCRGGTTPIGWGLGENPDRPPVEARADYLFIDNAAGTALFELKDDLERLGFLQDEVTALAYHGLPEGGRVAVIGVGGGKDILTALAFGAGDILGIEVNRGILRLLEDDYADFTGRLAERPEVRFAADEARSWLARHDERFDLVQASLIDSWAATAAGAFVLTENGLYTVEGWRQFLSRLTDEGVVTFSRWYVTEQPGETLRLLAVASDALRAEGAANPQDHLFVAASRPTALGPLGRLGVANVIASRTPLDRRRVERYAAAASKLGFEVLLSPQGGREELAAAIDPVARAALQARLPLDLRPATDDRPYFFNMVRPWRVFSTDLARQGITDFNIQAVRLLIYLVLGLCVLTGLGVLLPMRATVTTVRVSPRRAVAGALYFAGIGFGFMIFEVGQVHRLSLYLGHPTYGLVVVLLSLLLAAGLGSFVSGKIVKPLESRRAGLLAGAAFLLALVAFAVGTPLVLRAMQSAALPARVALSIVLVGVPGFLMGMPFPLGLRLAERVLADRLPWLWAINTACSVVGAAAAMLIGIGWGITASMGVGIACYALGGLFVADATRA